MHINKIYFLLLAILWSYQSCGQTISGDLNLSPDQVIRLEGFNGLRTYSISKTTSDNTGRFQLNYSEADYGVGYLMDAKEKPFIVMLSGENIEITGDAFNKPRSVEIIKGKENKKFQQYATEHPRREQILSAWVYLMNIYTQDTLFLNEMEAAAIMQEEIKRINTEDESFLATLNKDTYVSWYLPTRKLISSVSAVAQHQTEEIPATIAAYREIDYSDPRLYKSGLLKDAIDSHYWLLENMEKSHDSVLIEMNISTDALLATLMNDDDKFNEITNYLFDLLERQSLFEASEYLAIKALTQGSCILEEGLAKQLETYRIMKKGYIAPDFTFTGECFQNGLLVEHLPEKFSDLNTEYKLIVFGASWCPKCKEEIRKIAMRYLKWKEQNVEVVFISLDEEKNEFHNFVYDFPFLSYCDFKKWDSPIVEDYYIFATPTMFLLDQSNQIILRPNSVEQVDAWVDWYIASNRN